MLIWSCTDTCEEYIGQVVRTGSYTGEWQFMRLRNREIVERVPVRLAYGAAFGPDIDDANEWLRMVYAATERQKARDRQTRS